MTFKDLSPGIIFRIKGDTDVYWKKIDDLHAVRMSDGVPMHFQARLEVELP